MQSRRSLWFLCSVAVLVAGGIFADEVTQGLIYLVVGIASFIGIRLGLRRHRPENRRPWVLLSWGVTLFVGAAVARAIHGSVTGVQDPFPSPADLLGLSAYLISFYGCHTLLQSRSRAATRTLNLDAGIMALGIGTFVWVFVMGPYVTETTVPAIDRLVNTAYSVGDLLLAFMVVRVALTPGRRPLSYYLLAGAAGTALIADTLVILDLAGTFSAPGVIALASLPMAFVAASAIDVTMPQLTEQVDAADETFTTRRLALMALAILLPPSMLVVQEIRGVVTLLPVIVGAWAAVSLLAMARLAELIRAKERDVQRQSILLAADEALVAATDRGEILEAAIEAMQALHPDPGNSRFAAALMVDGDLIVEMARGVEAERAQSMRLGLADLSARGVNLASSRPSVVRSTLNLPGREIGWVTVTPLISQGDVIGALMVSSPAPPPNTLIDAAPSLATGVSLALESALLTEKIHRQRSERRFRSLVEQGSDVVAVLDERLAVTFVSAAAERLLERPIVELTGTRLPDLVIPDDRQTLESLISSACSLQHPGRSVGPAEIRVADRFGRIHTVEIVITDLRHDDVVDGIVINAHDVTGRKDLEESLRHQALHDSLTGLANRFMFQQRVSHALLRSSTIKDVVGVLFLDLDDFKTVNDSLGHAAGDKLLRLVAERLKACLHSGDTSARLGGDEFAILLEGTEHKSDVIGAAERILATLAEPFSIDSRLIEVGSSIGVAFADHESSDVDILLRNADVAMYAAKHGGKNTYRVFEQEMHASVFEKLELKAELAKALRDGDLTLAYQPIVSLDERKLVGFEALMRWTHATRGFIPPTTFIPIAEESGLIIPMGEWLLHEALGRLSDWHGFHDNASDIWMSVNVSVEQLADPSFVPAVRDALATSGMEARNLTLEVTESVLADDIDTITSRLHELKDIGVLLAIDDFGTGYSSLGYLQNLPFDKLKIDKSFIDLLERGTEDDRLVMSILDMAERLELPVVAEGIESAHQANRLMALNCQFGQGYHFARPMSQPDVVSLMARSSNRGWRLDALPAAVVP